MVKRWRENEIWVSQTITESVSEKKSKKDLVEVKGLGNWGHCQESDVMIGLNKGNM